MTRTEYATADSAPQQNKRNPDGSHRPDFDLLFVFLLLVELNVLLCDRQYLLVPRVGILDDRPKECIYVLADNGFVIGYN